MGESLELVEQNVKNNTEDIRELKEWRYKADRQINKIDSDNQLNKQNITHVMTTLSKMEGDIKTLSAKFDQNNEKQSKATEDQLASIKGWLWKFAVGLAVVIVGGFLTNALMGG